MLSRTWWCTAVALGLLFQGVAPAENRTYDGSSNNLQHPEWGTAGSMFPRWDARTHYEDGIGAPNGATRPNSRSVSNIIGNQLTAMPDAASRSDYVWQWGQFLDHDIALTPTGSEYFPIMVEDPLDPLGPMIPMMRSMAAAGTGTSSQTPRQQVNRNTSFIDASMVYGSSEARANALRAFDRGRMLLDQDGLLPRNVAGLENANDGIEPDATLFLAGDVRANEQLGLISMHTLFVREHNRLADEISAAQPGWDDERVYQQARKLVGGLVQNVTYREYLPALTGLDLLDRSQVYDPSVDPSLSNEFATALFRLGHTQVSPQLARVDSGGQDAPGGSVALADAFFVPSQIDSLEIDRLLRGLATQVQQATDPHMIDTLRNAMFGDPGAGGLDLLAINLQRGRDHGLASYTQFQEAFGVPVADDWADITVDPDRQAALELKYGSVDAIDLWIGVLSEDPVPGAAVGPTLQAALDRQFTNLLVGDRFFYEWDPALSLSEKQFIRESRLSDIIVRNFQIDRMDARQHATAVVGEMLTQTGVSLAPGDSGTESLTLDPAHDETVAEAVLRLKHVVDLRFRHTGRAGGLHQLGLDRQPGMAGDLLRLHHPARGSTHGQQPFAVGGRNRQPIGFLACTARQAFCAHEATAARHPSLEHRFKLRFESLHAPPSSLPQQPATGQPLTLATPLRRLLRHVAKQVSRHSTHLDLLRAFRDAVATMVTIDVFERLMPGITEPTVHLHCPVGGLTAKPVRPVVTHGDLVADGKSTVGVHLPCGFVNQGPEHFALGLQLDERKLYALVGRQRFAEGLALLGVLNRFVDAELGCAQARCRLADTVLVEEVLHNLQPAALAAKDCIVRHADVFQGDATVIGRHVKGPEHLLDLEAISIRRRQKAGDAFPVSWLAAGAGKDQVVLGLVNPGVPGFGTIDYPLVAVPLRLRLHMGGIRAMLGFGDPEGEAATAFR